MRHQTLIPLLIAGTLVATLAGQEKRPDMADVRLMTLDPGHFHAALIQKEMYPGVAPRVDVYAPLGFDLFEHLKRVDASNRRAEKPTRWETEIHAGPDSFARMLRERPGNVVIMSGRNRGKIDRVAASVHAGLHVLADKPWIMSAEELPKLEAVLAEADGKRIVAYDIMTERFEVTSMLQRVLVNDPAVFGEIERGAPDAPAVYMEGVHHLMKVVAGLPLIRPSWFFDINEQGEGLTDIGTHLVDLANWTLSPEKPIDYRTDVRVLAAQHWPTSISEEDYRRVTGEARFDPKLGASIANGKLDYYGNTLVSYTLRGVHVTLNTIWDWEAPAGGGDTHFAFYKGTRARVEVRQTKADGFVPELFVIPVSPQQKSAVLSAIQSRLASIQSLYPGIGVEERGSELHITIPKTLRVGHEAHFAQVASNFFTYLRNPSALPSWERSHMVAKYFVTTKGTALSLQGPARPAPRIAPR